MLSSCGFHLLLHFGFLFSPLWLRGSSPKQWKNSRVCSSSPAAADSNARSLASKVSSSTVARTCQLAPPGGSISREVDRMPASPDGRDRPSVTKTKGDWTPNFAIDRLYNRTSCVKRKGWERLHFEAAWGNQDYLQENASETNTHVQHLSVLEGQPCSSNIPISHACGVIVEQNLYLSVEDMCLGFRLEKALTSLNRLEPPSHVHLVQHINHGNFYTPTQGAMPRSWILSSVWPSGTVISHHLGHPVYHLTL